MAQNNSDYQIIKINDKKVTINQQWLAPNDLMKPEPSIKKEVKKTGHSVGLLYNQRFFLNGNQTKGTIAGAAVIASELKNCLTIYRIPNIEAQVFWCVGINERGQILPGYDTVADEERISEMIDELGVGEGEDSPVIYCQPIETQKNGLFEGQSGTWIEPKDIDELFKTKGQDATFEIKILQPKESTTTIIAIVALILAGIYGASEMVFVESPSFKKIKMYKKTFYSNAENIQNMDTSFVQKEKIYTEKAYENLGKKAIKDRHNNKLLTTPEIILTADKLLSEMPEYFYEWQKTRITYHEDAFMIQYKILPLTNGTAVEFKTKMEKFLAKNIHKLLLNSNTKIFIDPSKNIATVEFRLENKKVLNDYSIAEQEKLIALQKEKEDQIKKNEAKRQAELLEDEFKKRITLKIKKLEFYEKWDLFSRKPKNIEKKAKQLIRDLKVVETNLKKYLAESKGENISSEEEIIQLDENFWPANGEEILSEILQRHKIYSYKPFPLETAYQIPESINKTINSFDEDGNNIVKSYRREPLATVKQFSVTSGAASGNPLEAIRLFKELDKEFIKIIYFTTPANNIEWELSGEIVEKI